MFTTVLCVSMHNTHIVYNIRTDRGYFSFGFSGATIVSSVEFLEDLKM